MKFKARVEELIRRAEAYDTGGASERSRTLATRLRSTVLRPLAELDPTDPSPAGTMPCDGAWPADRVSLFERWIAEGCAD